jgi:hypothetical protein
MTRITLIATAALAAVALAAPVATAQLPHEGRAGYRPQANTAYLPAVDVRSPDARDAGVDSAPGLPTWRVDPEPIAAPAEVAPVSGDDDVSPLFYILPGVALGLLLAGGLALAVRATGRARISA